MGLHLFQSLPTSTTPVVWWGAPWRTTGWLAAGTPSRVSHTEWRDPGLSLTPRQASLGLLTGRGDATVDSEMSYAGSCGTEGVFQTKNKHVQNGCDHRQNNPAARLALGSGNRVIYRRSNYSRTITSCPSPKCVCQRTTLPPDFTLLRVLFIFLCGDLPCSYPHLW